MTRLSALWPAVAALALLAAPSPAEEGGPTPWDPVARAFAAGTKLPSLDVEGADREFYERLQKLSDGPPPCVSAKRRERFKASIVRACFVLRTKKASPRLDKLLKLTDAIADVYLKKSPDEAACAAAKAAGARAPGGTAEEPTEESARLAIKKADSMAKVLTSYAVSSEPAAPAASSLDPDDAGFAAGKLPEIDLLLAKAEAALAVIDRPPLEITPAGWLDVEDALPELQESLAAAKKLFEDTAEPQERKARRGKDKKYLAAYEALEKRRKAAEKKAAGLKLDALAARLPKMSLAAQALNDSLAAYAKTGGEDDLKAAVRDLNAFFDAAEIKKKDQAKILKDFQKRVGAGKVDIVEDAGGPRLSFAKTKDAAAPAAGQKTAAARKTEANNLEIAAWAAIAELDVSAGTTLKAKREKYKLMRGNVDGARSDAALALLRAWAGKDAKLDASAAALEKNPGDPKLLREADSRIERYLKKKAEAGDPLDEAAMPELQAYVDSRSAAARFYGEWLYSGAAPRGVPFYESELTPFQDTDLLYVKVEKLGGKLGRREYYEHERTSFVSDDGSLTHATGRIDSKYAKHLADLGIASDEKGGTYDELVGYSGKRVKSRAVTLTSVDGSHGVKRKIEDEYAKSKLAVRRETTYQLDSDDAIDVRRTMTMDGGPDGQPGFMVEEFEDGRKPWRISRGYLQAGGKSGHKNKKPKDEDASTEFVVTSVSDYGDERVYERHWDADKSEWTYYRDVGKAELRIEGYPDEKLRTAVYKVDRDLLADSPDEKTLRRRLKRIAKTIGKELGWSKAMQSAVGDFLIGQVIGSEASFKGLYIGPQAASGPSIELAFTQRSYLARLSASTVGCMLDREDPDVFMNTKPSGCEPVEALVVQRSDLKDQKDTGGAVTIQQEYYGRGETYSLLGETYDKGTGTYKGYEWVYYERGKVSGQNALIITKRKTLAEWKIAEWGKPGYFDWLGRQVNRIPGVKKLGDAVDSSFHAILGGGLMIAAGVTDLAGEDRTADVLYAGAFTNFGSALPDGAAKEVVLDEAENLEVKTYGEEQMEAEAVQAYQGSIGFKGTEVVFEQFHGDEVGKDSKARRAAIVDGYSFEGLMAYGKRKGGADAVLAYAGDASHIVYDAVVFGRVMPFFSAGAMGAGFKTATIAGASVETAAAVGKWTSALVDGVFFAPVATHFAQNAVDAGQACFGTTGDCVDALEDAGRTALEFGLSLAAFKYSGADETTARLNKRYAERVADAYGKQTKAAETVAKKSALEADYELLGLEPGATKSQVKRAWQGKSVEPGLQEGAKNGEPAALQRLAELKNAYTRIKAGMAAAEAEPAAPPGTDPSPAAPAERGETAAGKPEEEAVPRLPAGESSGAPRSAGTAEMIHVKVAENADLDAVHDVLESNGIRGETVIIGGEAVIYVPAEARVKGGTDALMKELEPLGVEAHPDGAVSKAYWGELHRYTSRERSNAVDSAEYEVVHVDASGKAPEVGTMKGSGAVDALLRFLGLKRPVEKANEPPGDAAPSGNAKASVSEMLGFGQKNDPKAIQRSAMEAYDLQTARREPAGTRVAGNFSSDAIATQKHNDCAVRATFNMPALAPIRDALFQDYDRYLVLAEKLANTRLRDKGTSGEHLRIIMNALGFNVYWEAMPAKPRELASRVHVNAGALYAAIDGSIPAPRKGKARTNHGVTIDLAYRTDGPWTFVVSDPRYASPQLYTFEKLGDVGAVTLRLERRINPETNRTFTDAELVENAVRLSNDKAARAEPPRAGFWGWFLSKLRPPKTAPAEKITIDTAAEGPSSEQAAELPAGKLWKAVSSEPDPVGGGRFLTAEGPEVTDKGEADMRLIVKDFPGLAKALDISIVEAGVRYPDTAGLNARLAKYRGTTVDKLPFKFVDFKGADGTGGEVPPREFLELIARGEVPISVGGSHHFHDISVHLVGWIAVPEGLSRFMIAEAGRMLRLADDPAFGPEAERGRFMDRRMKDAAEYIDNGTAGLVTNKSRKTAIRLLARNNMREIALDFSDALAEKGLDSATAKRYETAGAADRVDEWTAQAEARIKKWKEAK